MESLKLQIKKKRELKNNVAVKISSNINKELIEISKKTKLTKSEVLEKLVNFSLKYIEYEE